MKKFLLSMFLLLGMTSFALELTSSGIKDGVIEKKMELMEKINTMECQLFQFLLNGKMHLQEQSSLF